MSARRRLEKLEQRLEREVETSGPGPASQLLAARIANVLKYTEPGDPVRERILTRLKEIRAERL